MIIDCDTCMVRGAACGDCVVTVLLGTTPSGLDLDDGERLALDVLADSGLVPPLRLRPHPPGGSGRPPLGEEPVHRRRPPRRASG